jgi:LysR family transcriptional regulator, glycine cleavage system transcriptional activator
MKIRTASMVELHAFLAVCQSGSMRQAAEQLSVTQGAVSRAVARLEQRVGHALFERSAQGVAPTAQAQALRARIQSSVDELERVFTSLGRAAAQRSLVRISVVPTLGTRWLVPRLAQFEARHPHIDVELRQFHHDEDFRREDVDLWIAIKRPGKRWPRDISATVLLGREITPVCTQAIARRLRSPHDLLHQRLLHHTNYPENWQLWLNAAGVEAQGLVLGSGYDVGNNLIVAACAGTGVAVIQPCLVERELGSGELVLPFDLAVATGRSYCLCRRKSTSGGRAIEAFARWICGQAGIGAALK